MLRSGVLLLASALVVTAAAELAHSRPAEAEAGHNITLRGKFVGGAWASALSHKLVRTGTGVSTFTLCAVWDQPRSRPFNCRAARGVRLPRGTELRLEQRPIGNGLRRPDSPGWGMLGLSVEPSIRIPLSNNVTGNRLGTVRFRVTLRQRSSGKILYRSNALLLRWRR